MRLIDADALDEKLDVLMVRYAALGRRKVAEDYNFVRTVLLTAPTIEVPRWIPVTERLPEADINVLAITASGHFKVAGCNFYETEVYWRTNDGLGNNSITHWMPLPDVPKDGE